MQERRATGGKTLKGREVNSVEGSARDKNIRKAGWGWKKGGDDSPLSKCRLNICKWAIGWFRLGWCLCWNVLIPAIAWHFDLGELQVVEAKLTGCSGCSAFLLCILLIFSFLCQPFNTGDVSCKSEVHQMLKTIRLSELSFLLCTDVTELSLKGAFHVYLKLAFGGLSS